MLFRSKVMTCLTITPSSVAEAIEQQADLIVAHHPLPFRPLRRLTTDSTTGRLLLDLAAHRIAVYSPHTALDSAAGGINQSWAEGLELTDIRPLVANDSVKGDDNEAVGSGRWGLAKTSGTLADIIARVKSFLAIDQVRVVGRDDQAVSRVAVGCGSGGSLLDAASRLECDCFITGEANFHTCLEAEAVGIGLILAGHFASERFALGRLAQYLPTDLAGVHVWASQAGHDPLRSVWLVYPRAYARGSPLWGRRARARNFVLTKCPVTQIGVRTFRRPLL